MERPEAATVVLPAYGVADAVATVIRDLAVAAYVLGPRGVRLDVLVLHGDDDVAAAAVQTAAELGLPLRTVPGPPSGPGAAYLAGFQQVVAEGRADLVVTMDANGRHDATQLPHLIDQLIADDLDVIIGSRWTRGSGTPGLTLSRWVLGRLANLAFRRLTGTRAIADATTSFRVARLPVVREFDFGGIPLTSHSVQTAFVAMAVARGYRIGEAAIIYRPPVVGGGGGLAGGDIAAFAGQLLTLRRQVDRTRQRRLSVGGRRFSDDHFGAAQDLERLGTAKRFFDWVLDVFDPYLQGRILEVGAGLGTITRKLIDRYPELSIVALEPAGNVFGDLASYAALTPRVTARRQTLADYEPDPGEAFDAVVYINVLEHIADDTQELQLAAKALRPGGTLLVFGPALEWLYSELDYRAGHYRRYSLRRLRALATSAGFEVASARYFDMLGVVPYLVVYRWLRHDDISGSTLWGYDRVVVPLSQLLQRVLVFPPLGKNVILIAVKR